jgi:hypothetical protein
MMLSTTNNSVLSFQLLLLAPYSRLSNLETIFSHTVHHRSVSVMEEDEVNRGRRQAVGARDVVDFSSIDSRRGVDDADDDDDNEQFSTGQFVPLDDSRGFKYHFSRLRFYAGRYEVQLIAMLTASTIISYADRQNMSLAADEILKEMNYVNADGVVKKAVEGYLLAAFFWSVIGATSTYIYAFKNIHLFLIYIVDIF